MLKSRAMKITRRELLAGAAGSWLALAPGRWLGSTARPKVALVTTTMFKYAHSEHFVDRFLVGYGWNSTWHKPPMDLVSLYVDQVGPDDLSRERAARFPSMKIYPTIAEALTLGLSKLAVDGVLLIGEHGNYPKTEKGQVQY